MQGKYRILWIAIVTFVCVSTVAQPAHALDRRLKLMFKTGGYGALGGALIGAGSMALGAGGFRNVLMGASSGLYAGILLAAYIVATPNENENRVQTGNPYSPRKPVGPDDWEGESNDEEDLKPHLPPKKDDSGMLWPSKQQVERSREVAVWTPLVTLSF